MVSPENILLHLADEQEALIRELFAQLSGMGFPAQQQTPHITVSFAPRLEPRVVEKAAELLPPLIPASFQRVGTVVFGTKRKQSVAWLLETCDEMEIAARAISESNPAGRGPRWIPHLTMGLRLPRKVVPDYVRALDSITPTDFKTLTAVRAGYWRPRLQQVTVLGGNLVR